MEGGQKKVIILGATGSIGRSAIEVAMERPQDFRVVAASAAQSAQVCMDFAAKLGARAYVGEGSSLRAVEENEADVCLVATVGESGILPTMAAIKKGMDVALATKEVLVMAGRPVMEAAADAGVRILPVDSEHSAIYQCLYSGDADSVERLTLTASGGPFLDTPGDISNASPAAALRHPKWKMGRKITVDSSTMMNKGFEIAEAKWLFGIPEDRIDVLVHPQSVIHGLVTFRDGSTIAQMSPPDMHLAIQYALSCPERLPSDRPRLDLAELATLTFSKPDEERFPCLALARQAYKTGGCAPAVMAAADEWAVGAFLSGWIKFGRIPGIIENCLAAAPDWQCDTVEAALEAAAWTRREISSGRLGVAN